jgi:hypothetical protein
MDPIPRTNYYITQTPLTTKRFAIDPELRMKAHDQRTTPKKGRKKRFGNVKTEKSLRSLPAIATRTENGMTTDFFCEQRACNGTKRRVFVLLLFAAMSQS